MSASLRRKERVLVDVAELFRAKDYSRAEHLLRELVEDDARLADEQSLSLWAEACLERALAQGGDLDEVALLLHRVLSLPSLSCVAYAGSLNRLGIVSYYQQRYKDAIELYREALDVLPGSAETRVLQNRIRGNLAESLRSSDDPGAAHVEYLKAMEHLDAADDLYTQGALYLGLAANEHDRGRDDLAVPRALHAQSLFDRLGDPMLSSLAGLHHGYFLISNDLLEPAIESIHQGLAVAQLGGDLQLQFLSRYHLAMVAFHRRAYSEAERLARAAYQVAKDNSFYRYLVQSTTLLAEIAVFAGDQDAAMGRWVEAGNLCEQLGLMQRAGQIWQRVGMALSEQGDLDGSRRFIQRALRCLHSSPLPAMLDRG